MIAGTLTQNADTKTFTLSVATLMFDIARLNVVPNGYKTADNHPDFHIEVRTPRGRVMRVGSMWSARRQDLQARILSRSPSPTAWAGPGA